MTRSSFLVGAAATATRSFALATAGADRVVAYHSSVYRDLGIPSVAGLLPWASANAQTLEMLPSVIAGARKIPVVATICANDRLLTADEMVERVRLAGAEGVLNAPTVGLIEGIVREILELEGLGMDREIALISLARTSGLESWIYVFDDVWTEDAIEAGATGLVVHVGITTPRSPRSRSLEIARQCLAAAQRQRSSVPVLLHGGSLTSPAELADFLALLSHGERALVSGFFGASAFDAHPTLAEWRSILERE